MMTIFSDLIEYSIEIFMDDFSILGEPFQKFLDNIELVMQICEESNLGLNWEKFHFIVKEA